MIAIIEGVEFEVDSREEALSGASIFSEQEVAIRDRDGWTDHYKLVEGQWYFYWPVREVWLAVHPNGLFVDPLLARADLGTPVSA